MAAITASGVGSGLDVESLVSQLMAVERKPIDTLNTKISSYNTRLSAYGQVKGALSALQTAAEAISTPAKFAAYTTTLSDSSLFSAATGTGAVAGSYAVDVRQLAQNHKVASAGLASSSATVSTGTLTIQLGQLNGGTYTPDASRTLTINITSSNNSLTAVRDAINAANGGVTATIVNDGSANPARLVVSSKDSGTANTIKMSGIAELSFDPLAPSAGSTTQTVASQDAIVKIDGITLTKSSNTITDGIDGVTLKLTKANPGNPVTMNVATDTTTIQNNIQSFVKAYNDLNTLLRSQTSYDAATKKAGTLNGDGTVRSISGQLRNLVGGQLASSLGGFSRLSDLGITFQTNGSLSVDSTKLSAALTDPTKSVSTFFTSSGTTKGLAVQTASAVKSMLATDGILTSRTDGINSSIKSMNNRIDALETRMTQIEKRYRAQFTSLDSLMSSMNTTSSYLTQQLAKL